MRLLLTLACAALALSGCANKPDITKREPNAKGEFYGTHIFAMPCKTELASTVGTSMSALVAPLVGATLKTGLNWIGTAFAKAGKDHPIETRVHTNLASLNYLWGKSGKENGSSSPGVGFNPQSQNINGNATPKISDLRCVQVVRGTFQHTTDHDPVSDYAVPPMNPTLGIQRATFKLKKGTEELFIELLPLASGNAVAFVPLEVRYRGYDVIEEAGEQPRALALAIGFALPGTDVSGGQFAGRVINFGKLTPDDSGTARLSYVHPKDKTPSLLNHTQWLPVGEGEMDQPVTLAAIVTETRTGSELAKFLGEVFSSGKVDLETAVDTSLAELELLKTSAELKSEKASAEQAALTSETAYLNAEVNVLTQEELLASTCEAPSPSPAKILEVQRDLYVARRTANLTAKALGKEEPYPNAKSSDVNSTCP